jgi:hypothetical protein
MLVISPMLCVLFAEFKLGTALLRKVMTYVPMPHGITGQIRDVWILLRFLPNALRWTACHGIYCAKILARVKHTRSSGSPELAMYNGAYIDFFLGLD